MNKIKQILSLFTCLMILLSVAVLRSNKIWGNQLGGEKTEVADSLSAGPIVTADDGSMVVKHRIPWQRHPGLCRHSAP